MTARRSSSISIVLDPGVFSEISAALDGVDVGTREQVGLLVPDAPAGALEREAAGLDPEFIRLLEESEP